LVSNLSVPQLTHKLVLKSIHELFHFPPLSCWGGGARKQLGGWLAAVNTPQPDGIPMLFFNKTSSLLSLSKQL